MSNRQSLTEFNPVDDGDDLIQRCSDIFAHESGPYKTAKQFSIQNLSETHEQDIDTLLSFRKALTDVGEFFDCLEQSNVTQAEEKLEKIQDHLRETACKSANVTTDYYIERIENNEPQLFLFYRLLLLDAPSKQEFNNVKNAIDRSLKQAERKDLDEWEEKISDFQEAREYACSLHEELPASRKVKSRFVIMFTTIVGTAVSIVSFLNVLGVVNFPEIPL